MFKKIIVTISLLVIVTPTFAGYKEVDCSSDPVFAANSCGSTDQCFDGGAKEEGNNIGLLSDIWMNVTDVSKLLFKEEQLDPEMINLDKDNVSWSQSPDKNNFWTYTKEFDALYSDDYEGYVLPAGQSVTWLKSTLSSVFTLDKNTSASGSDIGLLVFPISTHNILADGEITMDNDEHRECVLFKSAGASEVKKEVVPKKLPQTGPAEYLLLLFLSLILGFGMLKFKTRS